MMDVGVVVPFFNHERAIEGTVERLKRHGLRTWIVDDGSDESCAPVLQRLAERESAWLTVRRLPRNAGKGVAVVDGFRALSAAGLTHALQIDADGQHDFDDIPRMLAVARAHLDAIVTGVPIFDHTVPTARRYGRELTTFWVRVNTLSPRMPDAMCGFRIYPLRSVLEIAAQEGVGQRMEFDPEVLVRAAWRGVPIMSMPTRVTYPRDGVSHFKMVRDNVRITAMHTRLFFGMLVRVPRFAARALRRGS